MCEFGTALFASAAYIARLDLSADTTSNLELPGAVAGESSWTPNTACAPATTAAGPNAGAVGLSACSHCGAACARKQANAQRKKGAQRACVDPRPRTRRDSAGQPPPAASTARPPTTSRSGTARHHRSDRRPNRGSQSTSRTNLRHRRAPQKRTRQKHHRRSRAFAASILRRTRPWPPIPLTYTTGPSARR